MSNPFNGHRSWNAWNVSLWIANDEALYTYAVDCICSTRTLDAATHVFMKVFGGEKTPDGAVYNKLSVRAALAGLEIS